MKRGIFSGLKLVKPRWGRIPLAGRILLPATSVLMLGTHFAVKTEHETQKWWFVFQRGSYPFEVFGDVTRVAQCSLAWLCSLQIPNFWMVQFPTIVVVMDLVSVFCFCCHF